MTNRCCQASRALSRSATRTKGSPVARIIRMATSSDKKKILVIDDDPDICQRLDSILSADGYLVVTAKDGREGLEMARLHQPNVILLDVMMPVLDGYGFLDAQRADPTIFDIPVIVLSAGVRLDRIPNEIPRLPKPPELLALFALIESRVNFPRRNQSTQESVPNVAST